MSVISSRTFLEALLSEGRAPEIPEADDIFGWLIGSWDIEAVLHWAKGVIIKRRGELHASWVLEGRTIQDLVIFPRRADRHAGTHLQGDRYATTIRTYDHTLHAWHVHFTNPAAPETNAQLIARRNGDGIALEGKLADNTPVRWQYIELTKKSFHFVGERRSANEKSWELYLELFGKRAG